MELNVISSSPVTSSKVYIRYFDYTAYYEIDRVLPPVLDSNENGGTRTYITNDEWIAFCNNIDETFELINTMQCINFYADLIVGVAIVLYVVLSYLIFVIKLNFRVIYGVFVVVIVNAALRACVRGPLNTAAVHEAERICEEETARLNLRAGHGSSVLLVFHHRKRNCGNCEGYEFDRRQNQRYHEIFVEVTVRGPEAVAVDDCEATGEIVDEYFHQTEDLANAVPIATATEISTEAYDATNGQECGPLDPYITTPPMASAQFVGPAGDEAEEGRVEPPQ